MTPSYGLPGSGKRGFCVQHAEEGMVKLNRKMCSFRGCFVVAAYGNEGSNRKQFCAIHAADGMVLVSGKKCGRAECFKRATYGAPGGRKREFCAQHAKGWMVNVDARRCVGVGCSKRATYGHEDGPRRFCAQHAAEGMIDIANKECLREFCPKRARYGAEGSGRRDYCLQHAEDGMVNFDSKRCLAKDCPKSPTFGVPGTSRRQYCAQHALPGHINVAHKPCIRPGCAKRAAYGKFGTRERLYCAEHAKKGMIRHLASRFEGNESMDDESGESLTGNGHASSSRDGIDHGGSPISSCAISRAADGVVADGSCRSSSMDGVEMNDMDVIRFSKSPLNMVTGVENDTVSVINETSGDCPGGASGGDSNRVKTTPSMALGVKRSALLVSAGVGQQAGPVLEEGHAGAVVAIRPTTARKPWSPDVPPPLLQTSTGWSKWNWQAAMVGPFASLGR